MVRLSMPVRHAHHAVLPTKTSLIVQLVHWDVPSSSFFLSSLFHVLSFL